MYRLSVVLAALLGQCLAKECRADSKPLALVQLNSETEKALLGRSKVLTSRGAAAELKSHFQSTANVGSSLQGGLAAILKSLPSLTVNPPQIDEGFLTVGEELLEVIAVMLPESTRQAPDFSSFQHVFVEIFEELPSSVGPALSELLTSFAETGNAGALIEAFDLALVQAAINVTAILPDSSGLELAKYFGALMDAFESVGDAADDFALGDLSSAVQIVFDGLCTATKELGENGSEESCTETAGLLDGIFGDLMTAIVGHQYQVMESNVCWLLSQTVHRQKQRPSRCPAGYSYDGMHWCVTEESDSPVEGTGLLDTTVTRKTGDPSAPPTWQPPTWPPAPAPPAPSPTPPATSPSTTIAPAPPVPHGAVTPECEESGDYPEKLGTWCYAPCPNGSQPSGTTQHQCKIACVDEYPASIQTAPLLCGKTETAVEAAVQEMVTRTLRITFELAKAAASSGAAADLPGTIAALVELGKGFAHPQCPGSQQA